MVIKIKSRDYLRKEVFQLTQNGYEVIFSIFMVVIAYFLKSNPYISYPAILYLSLIFLFLNLLFNRMIVMSNRINIYVVDLMLILNITVITAIIYNSGGTLSYFWVLYLLPIFMSVLTVKIVEVFFTVTASSLILILLYFPFNRSDHGILIEVATKIAVFVFSSLVLYKTAKNRVILQEDIDSKKKEINKLMNEISQTNYRLLEESKITKMGRLVSGIIHDLKNSLTLIILSTEIMLGETSNEKLRENIERIIRAANLCKNLLINALNLVKNQEYHFEKIRIKDAIDSALFLLNFSLKAKNIKVDVFYEPDVPTVYANIVHLERVFINIILNSISVLKKGDKINISVRKVNESVEIVIKDNGPGFPEQILRQQGTAFESTRKSQGGTGLGLFVSFQIIHRLHGSIEIYNDKNGGAVVKIKIPVYKHS